MFEERPRTAYPMKAAAAATPEAAPNNPLSMILMIIEHRGAQAIRVSRIVEFYSGRAPDHAGRFLHDIQQWPDDRLEAVHDFIQWLFPLAEPSPVNPLAPVLDPEVIEAFAAQPELRENLRESFLRMLRFYGLEMQAGSRPVIRPGANFMQRSGNWLHPGNHNHLRITRILKSLALLGLMGKSRAFLECLERIYAEHPGAISAVSLKFWRAAIGPE